MVLIDFDETSMLASFPDIPDADDWATEVEVPVRLRIGNVDLLGWEHGWPKNWTGKEPMDGEPVFVIAFAWWGLVAVKQAKLAGSSISSLGMYGDRGELLFKMAGEDILVHSSPYRKTVKIRYEKLENAWKEFANRVREFILREFPVLKDKTYYTREEEPGWQEWLAGVETADLPVKLAMTVDLWSPYDDLQYVDRFDHVDAVET